MVFSWNVLCFGKCFFPKYVEKKRLNLRIFVQMCGLATISGSIIIVVMEGI